MYNPCCLMSTLPYKPKIVNDPVHGFMRIPTALCLSLIEHPWFQRLRWIRQLGLAHFVYPGAQHTRFQHAIGAMHLMDQVIDVLRSKGCDINDAEAEAVMVAILLHDIGHGPFSHALETSIVTGYSHESLSLLFMEALNEETGGRLSLAIDIFTNRYPKRFLHQLVSGQLDMDRLDYLKRDSFFTGVVEGVVSSDRILKMLTVCYDELAVEAKGIYSIEKFLIARRLMYWQVYYHKTAVSAEMLLIRILERARLLAGEGEKLFATPALSFFLNGPEEGSAAQLLRLYAALSDDDILVSVKAWVQHPDKVLSLLCSAFMSRKLFRTEIQTNPFDEEILARRRKTISAAYAIPLKEAEYFVFQGRIENHAYDPDSAQILIQMKDGSLADIYEVSDMENLAGLAKMVEKHYLCYPKEGNF